MSNSSNSPVTSSKVAQQQQNQSKISGSGGTGGISTAPPPTPYSTTTTTTTTIAGAESENSITNSAPPPSPKAPDTKASNLSPVTQIPICTSDPFENFSTGNQSISLFQCQTNQTNDGSLFGYLRNPKIDWSHHPVAFQIGAIFRSYLNRNGFTDGMPNQQYQPSSNPIAPDNTDLNNLGYSWGGGQTYPNYQPQYGNYYPGQNCYASQQQSSFSPYQGYVGPIAMSGYQGGHFNSYSYAPNSYRIYEFEGSLPMASMAQLPPQQQIASNHYYQGGSGPNSNYSAYWNRPNY